MRKKILLLTLVLTLPVSASGGVVSMSNKYCNLPGADKISETFQRINDGFDLVEADIDDTKEAIEKFDRRVDKLVNNPDPNKDLELVDLRNSNIYGVFPTAKARLDYTDNLFSSQLAENTTEHENFESQLAQKVDVRDARLKTETIGLNDVDEEMLAAIQGGEGTTFNLESIPRNYSVTPIKTDFIKVSTNLFDKNTVKKDTSINSSGEEYSSPNNNLGALIEVEPDTNYTVNKSFVIVYYDDGGNYRSQPVKSGTFTTPSYARWARLVVKSADLDTAQLNLGDTLLPYEPFYNKMSKKIEIPAESVEPLGIEKLNFIKKSTNLYNKNTTQKNKFVDSNGIIQESTEENALSDFIKVEPNTVYTLNKAHTTVYYDEDKNFRSRPNNTGTFTTPSYAHYVRLVMYNRDVNSAQLNKGDTLLPYEDFYIWFDDEVLIPPSSSSNKSYYFVPEEITGFYLAPEQEYKKWTNSNDYYDDLNQLAATYPDYIISTLKGNDASDTYPIYEYHLKPNRVEAEFLEKSLPKIIIVCGLHGDERSSIYSMYHMIKLLCENWQDDPLLEYLRWNVEIVTIPIANPYGFNHPDSSTYGGRHNANGVDLNRNFSERWDSGGSNEPGTQTYRGTAPFSEIESQYVKELIDNNIDALFFGDYHTNGSSGGEYSTLIWHSLMSRDYYSENVSVATSYYIGKITREFIKEYNLPSNEGNFGYMSRSFSGGLAKMYGASVGVDSCTIECFRKFPTETEYETDTNIKACTEYIINWLLTLLNQYKSVYNAS